MSTNGGETGMSRVTSGIVLIANERERQIDKEGWTAKHDQQHIGEELAYAAICYALPNEFKAEGKNTFWPWEDFNFKPTPDDRIRELAKAGALIAAEIDRLMAEKGAEPNENTCRNS
jgi:hypothetical protein